MKICVACGEDCPRTWWSKWGRYVLCKRCYHKGYRLFSKRARARVALWKIIGDREIFQGYANELMKRWMIIDPLPHLEKDNLMSFKTCPFCGWPESKYREEYHIEEYGR